MQNILGEKNDRRKIIWNLIKKYMVITVAAVGYGIGVAVFLDKNNLVPGGVSGLSIIINRLTGFETGTIIFFINVPILIIGIWKFGFTFIFGSLYAIIVSSAVMNFFSSLPSVTDDILISAVMGGALVSACLGIIFKEGATTGGMDIIVKLIKLKYKQFKTGTIFLMVDTVVVMMAMFVFDNINFAFYSAITVVISSVVLDMVLYGRDEARLLYIVLREEESEERLVAKLLKELDVGVTYLKGYGGYKNKEKKVILCAIHKNQLPKAKDIVRETDDNAFLIVTSANEIIGEGYKSHYMKSL